MRVAGQREGGREGGEVGRGSRRGCDGRGTASQQRASDGGTPCAAPPGGRSVVVLYRVLQGSHVRVCHFPDSSRSLTHPPPPPYSKRVSGGAARKDAHVRKQGRAVSGGARDDHDSGHDEEENRCGPRRARAAVKDVTWPVQADFVRLE
ncbi:hypothetical protein O3P69_009093 [Scylla paramamosain]|uniref:Uncharacterized protein n=1 Tax=Scylla paramamosain TaxID=85552 RepID=A0AAW0TQ05_SCYPA